MPMAFCLRPSSTKRPVSRAVASHPPLCLCFRRGAPVEVWRPCPLLRPPRFDRCPVSHRSVASSTLPMFQALTRPLKCGRPCPLLHPTPNRPTADPSTPPVCPARLGPTAQGVLHQSASCCSAHLPPIHSRPSAPSSFRPWRSHGLKQGRAASRTPEFFKEPKGAPLRGRRVFLGARSLGRKRADGAGRWLLAKGRWQSLSAASGQLLHRLLTLAPSSFLRRRRLRLLDSSEAPGSAKNLTGGSRQEAEPPGFLRGSASAKLDGRLQAGGRASWIPQRLRLLENLSAGAQEPRSPGAQERRSVGAYACSRFWFLAPEKLGRAASRTPLFKALGSAQVRKLDVPPARR